MVTFVASSPEPVYLERCLPCAQVAAQMKGDREDRIKIQARKEADKRRMDDEQKRDELLVEASTMARMGARRGPTSNPMWHNLAQWLTTCSGCTVMTTWPLSSGLLASAGFCHDATACDWFSSLGLGETPHHEIASAPLTHDTQHVAAAEHGAAAWPTRYGWRALFIL